MEEWILSLVMSREHAGGTVGDLVETSSLSPWIVTRIFLSAIGNGLWSARGRMTLLAIGGFIGQFLLFFPLMAIVGGIQFRPWLPGRDFFPVVFFLTQILIGHWLAKGAPGRELSACVALGILNVAAGLLNVNNISISMAFWQIPVIIGALSVRWGSMRHA
jgi:hypothetical protein